MYEVGYSGHSLTADQFDAIIKQALQHDPELLISGHAIRTTVRFAASLVEALYLQAGVEARCETV